jgi:hypothetical protein
MQPFFDFDYTGYYVLIKNINDGIASSLLYPILIKICGRKPNDYLDIIPNNILIRLYNDMKISINLGWKYFFEKHDLENYQVYNDINKELIKRKLA